MRGRHGGLAEGGGSGCGGGEPPEPEEEGGVGEAGEKNGYRSKGGAGATSRRTLVYDSTTFSCHGGNSPVGRMTAAWEHGSSAVGGAASHDLWCSIADMTRLLRWPVARSLPGLCGRMARASLTSSVWLPAEATGRVDASRGAVVGTPPATRGAPDLLIL
jgi:hypothetical protein